METQATAAPAARAPRLTGVYVMLSIILALVLAIGGCGAYFLLPTLRPEAPEATTENGAVVAGYVVRSTEPISEAYRSGDESALTDAEKETLKLASDVLAEIIDEKTMTVYEQEKAVYEWMCANISTDGSGLSVIVPDPEALSAPRGVLANRTAVCVGYATTFRLFMQMLGIPCKVVHNVDGYHSWDEVQLDGEWYHVDVYSDNGTGGYANFNMNDAMLQWHGQAWDREYFPAADGVKYNAFYAAAEKMENVFDLPKRVRAALDGEKNIWSAKLPADLSEHDMRILQEMLNDLYSWVSNTQYSDLSLQTGAYRLADCCLATVSFIRPADPLTDEDREKMNDAWNDAFGDIYWVL